MTPIVTTSSRKRKKRNNRTVFLFVAVAILATGLVIMYRNKPDKPVSVQSQATSVKLPRNVVDGIATNEEPPIVKPSASVSTSITERVKSNASKDGDIFFDAGGIMRASDTNNFVRRPGYLMLPTGRILTFKPPEEGETVQVHSFGRVYECDSEGNFKDITKPPVFDNKFENQLIGLATPGSIVFGSGLLNHTPEELDEVLHKEVVINPDDDEDVVYKKQAVAAMKKQILEYLADGGSFEEFVQRMQSYSKEERRLRTKGMNKLEDLLEAGDIENARKFVKTYNEILDENCFAPLKITKKWREQLYPDGDPTEEPQDDAQDEGAPEEAITN